MKKFLKIFFFVFIFLFNFNFVFATDPEINLDMGIGTDGVIKETTTDIKGISKVTSGYGGLNTAKNLQDSLRTILNVILGIGGTISLGFIVVGGAKILFSGGKKADYAQSVKLMSTGAVAFLIIVFAYLITTFVLNFITTIAG